MCFGLSGIREVADGQIAHLDRDPSNFNIDNLAYLCLECHKNYDLQSNRVLGYTPGEIAHYRDQLYRALSHDRFQWTLTIRADRSRYESVKAAVQKAHATLRDCSDDVSLNEAPLE